MSTQGTVAARPTGDPHVASAILHIRERLELSREELGAALAVPSWLIVAWERGWREPCGRSVAMLSKMACDGGAQLLDAMSRPSIATSIVAADLSHLREDATDWAEQEALHTPE